MKTSKDYKSNTKPTWCAGCGDYAVMSALMSVMAELNIEPDDTTVVSGIGCSSRMPFFLKTYGFHSIHGRALPIAIGLKCSRPETNVITVGGDGDGFSIGGNHFIHASRKNPDLTYIVMDNEIYALTKGQNSPTSHDDLITKVNPYLPVEDRLNPVAMALSFETSFVARGFSGNLPQLKSLIKQGIEHKGFSFIHVLSPCIQYNQKLTYETLKQRIMEIPEGHNTSSIMDSMQLIYDTEHVHTGVFFKKHKPTLEDKLEEIVSKAQKNIDEKEYVLKDIMQQFG